MTEDYPQLKPRFTKVPDIDISSPCPPHSYLLVNVAESIRGWAHSLPDRNIRGELELHHIVKRGISRRGNYI